MCVGTGQGAASVKLTIVKKKNNNMSTLKGGEFLIKEIEAKNIFTMEDFLKNKNA